MGFRVKTGRILWALALGMPGFAQGACLFDDFGDIVNPTDPSCRDVQLRYTRDDDSGNNIALGYDVPLPVDSLTGVDGFRSYQSLHEQHQALDVASSGVQGSIVGLTLGGRAIWAYRIGDPDDLTADGGVEAAALINGTIHAREWQSPEAVTELFEQLEESADDGGIGQYLHENLSVVILPVLNVDGFLQTQRYPDRATASELQPRDGRMRRKNMRHPSSGSPVDEDLDQTPDNFFGVDLNRNNPAGFAQNNGSSSRTTSLAYRGAVPSSEPEIAALLAAADLAPSDRLRMYVDTHSFSQIFFTPITGNQRRDLITRDLVNTMRLVLGSKYRYGPSAQFIGLTSEYFATRLMIPAWTLEIEPLNGAVFGSDHAHSGFVLPNSEVARMRDEVAAMLLAGLYTQADKPALRAIRIRDDQTQEIRFDADWADAGPGRRLTIKQNVALLPGRRYQLWLGFNKPMRWRGASGTVAGFHRLPVPPAPVISVQFPQLPATSDLSITVDDAAWIQQVGPEGAIRYRDDALRAVFTIPDTLPVTEPTPMVIAVDASDITRSRLDADPATRVGWGNGHWTGYEDEGGIAGDTGGIDCQFVSFVAMVADASPPTYSGGCRTATSPPSPPSTGNGSGSGGGGGAVLWLLLALPALVVSRKIRW